MKRIILIALLLSFVAATGFEGSGEYELNIGDAVKGGEYKLVFNDGTGQGYGEETHLDGEFTLYSNEGEENFALSEGETFSFGSSGTIELLKIVVDDGEVTATISISFPDSVSPQLVNTKNVRAQKITSTITNVRTVKCITSEDGTCINQVKAYKAITDCSNAACLRTRLNVDNLGEKIRSCNAQDDEESCLNELRERWLNWLQYTLQKYLDIVDSVEDRGVPTELCDEIRETLTQSYDDFVNASSKEERRAILSEVNAAWKEFRNEAARYLLLEKASALAVRAENAVQTLEGVRNRLQERGLDVTELNEAIESAKQSTTAIGESENVKDVWGNARKVRDAVMQGKSISQSIINGRKNEFKATIASVPSIVAEVEVETQ